MRRSRPLRRVRRIRRVPNVHYFKRSAYFAGFVTSSIANDTFSGTSFQLSQIAGFTEMAALFDQYKITSVKWSLIPRGNVSDITSATVANSASSVGVFSVVDFDDIAPFTNIQQACEYTNMKMTRSHQVHSRTLRPKVNVQMLTTLGANVPANTNNSPWLDTAYSNIPYYGIKWILQQSPNQAQQYDLKIDYIVACKNVN